MNNILNKNRLKLFLIDIINLFQTKFDNKRINFKQY